MALESKKIYMIGIKGVGMTMLAQYLACQGWDVSGSDVLEKFMTDKVLSENKIKVYGGFNPENVPLDADFYVYSSAYNPANNKELEFLANRNIRALKLSDMLAGFFNQKQGIAVAGTHGKTTVSAWLAYVLKQSGSDPSAMIGALVPQLNGFCLCGGSDRLIIEADEYQNKIRSYKPQGVLLNNIDFDHPDYFKDQDDYIRIFVDFVKKIPKKGFVVANFDNENIRKYIPANTRAEVISYAMANEADYVAYDVREQGTAQAYRQIFKVKLGADSFTLEDDGASVKDSELGEFSIRLAGRHNIHNALAVIASCLHLGLSLLDIRIHLEEFKGTARRLEEMGKFRGALLLDDYAHHPEEVKASIAAARGKYAGRRLVVVFHPHTFSRTERFFSDFVSAFKMADELIVLDIYGSAREQSGQVTSQDLVESIREYNRKNGIDQPARHLPGLKEAESCLRRIAGPKDAVLLMGAGDVFRVGERLLDK